MRIEGQGYFYQVLYVLCLYKAQISGERLQDHWSSGLIFVGIGVTFACDDFIFYVIIKRMPLTWKINKLLLTCKQGLLSFCNLIKLMLNA